MGIGTRQETKSYQESLRKLGAWLDAVRAVRVNILELVEGFAARYQQADVDVVIMQRFFTHHDVLALRWGDHRLRQRIRRQRGLARESGGYQDLFRALGFVLDEKSASLIQLDERDNDLIVTYLTPDASDGSTPKQCRDVFGPDERAALREHAKQRRREQARWRWIVP
jgi:hypothetical protein